MNADKKSQSVRGPIAKRFLLLFLPLFLIATGISTCIVISDIKIEEDKQATREFQNAGLLKWTAMVDLKLIIADLHALASHTQLRIMWESPSLFRRQSVEQEMAAFIDRQALYHQVRILNKEGAEIIRIDHHDGEAIRFPPSEIPDQKDHPFFSDTFDLEEGDTLICPAEEMIGYNPGEPVPEPVIKFGTPVFDCLGVKRGIVILNYQVARMIHDLERVGGRTGDHRLFLLRSDGRYLRRPSLRQDPVSSAQQGDKDTFYHNYPQAWERIAAEDSGQLSTAEGVFTFTTVPLPGNSSPRDLSSKNARLSASSLGDSCPPFWKIVSIVPEDVIKTGTKEIMVKWLPVYGLFSLLLLFVSWHLARADVERRLMEDRLRMLATTDDLTGVNNRRQYVELTKREIRRCQRYGSAFSAIMIDVDHFKMINDSYGHPVGDEVLKALTRTCQENTRENDILGRMGGDEFACTLLECDLDKAVNLAERLCTSVSEVVITTSRGDIRFSISAGVAQLIPGEDGMASLLRRADQALYTAKRQGRNQVAAAE